jgi:hypothetical protein
MRRILLFIAGAALLTACNNQTKSDTATLSEDTTVAAAVALPFTATYSSSFKMGNPEYSAMILQGSWKDWENNTMDNMKSWIADTIVALHSDNTMIRGADSLVANWKKARAKYTSVIDTIEAVTPLYSTDKNENWVCVWAREINTKKDGTKDSAAVMETWRINKDGKADLLLQYDRAKRKM